MKYDPTLKGLITQLQRDAKRQKRARRLSGPRVNLYRQESELEQEHDVPGLSIGHGARRAFDPADLDDIID